MLDLIYVPRSGSRQSRYQSCNSYKAMTADLCLTCQSVVVLPYSKGCQTTLSLPASTVPLTVLTHSVVNQSSCRPATMPIYLTLLPFFSHNIPTSWWRVRLAHSYFYNLNCTVGLHPIFLHVYEYVIVLSVCLVTVSTKWQKHSWSSEICTARAFILHRWPKHGICPRVVLFVYSI